MSEVKITVNGKQYTASTEKTLLDNIVDNEIHIPHLCHNRFLECYGGCGLCLVEVEGVKKPLRACSTAVKDGMVVNTKSEALEKSRKESLGFILSNHAGDCKAPCFMACPTHQDVQSYVGLIANGKTDEAVKVIKQDNPLPASIGRVCPHPCEKKCRRGLVDEPISICALKRFAADEFIDYIPECEKKNGKKVAVVGGGPAGLSCAYFLLMKGYDVEIFEAQEKCGGMLRYGIPAYRLPKNILDREIENIEKMGAVIHTNSVLGSDETVEALKSKFDAVFIGTGAWKSGTLRCENDNADGVIGGIDFLYKVAKGEKIEIGEDVAVVGGGNTAIDAVRTAVRLGAKNVTLIYRRTENEMPAEKSEIAEAKEEGVQFKFLCAPLKVVTENGRMTGLLLQKMKQGEPDASGRRSPVPIEGETEQLHFDTVISAVGQSVVSNALSSLELTKRGTIAVDENTFATSDKKVFAAGDAVNKGPDIAIKAIAGGKNAARAIDCMFKGVEVLPELPDYSINYNFDASVLGNVQKISRQEFKVENPEIRKNNFEESAYTFTQREALEEASRCLECGCSSVYDCKLLPLMREYDSFKTSYGGEKKMYEKDASHPFIVRDNNKCILCALCVRACREISGTENLGLFGRGFATVPTTAFGEKLSESKCVSCGACVSVCPTGALTSKTPTVKNIVLPFEEEKCVCNFCDRKCEFTRRKVNGRTVKMIPDDLRRKCSVGMFAEVAVSNIETDISEEAKRKIISCINGDTKFYTGNVNDIKSFEAVKQKFNNI